MIRVILPAPLCELAKINGEVSVELEEPFTFDALISVLEEQYPALRGTIRDVSSKKRRAMIRIFACEQDCSHLPLGSELPAEVIAGKEPLIIVGAIAGG